jgi:hypothetical protein
VTHFYPSEFGADLTVGDNCNERYYRDKVLTRKHLQKRAAENSKFGYTYFLDGRFTEWAPTPHFGIDLKTHCARIVGSQRWNRVCFLLLSRDSFSFFLFSVVRGWIVADMESMKKCSKISGLYFTRSSY